MLALWPHAGARIHPFSHDLAVGCRVEEQALKDSTGVHRVTTVGDRLLDTSQRVISHSAQVVRGVLLCEGVFP